jgi:predicted cupin superfamily sugar epimerase
VTAPPLAEPRAAALVRRLGLLPHPEGGYYRELFRSPSPVTRAEDGARRAALTTIYFLLPAGAHSRWHQVRADEVWHLYEGGPLELHELAPDGTAPTRRLLAPVPSDDDPAAPRVAPVHTVPANAWQAARALGRYALVGCTVAPGFDFADFKLLADDPPLAAAVRAGWPGLGEMV